MRGLLFESAGRPGYARLKPALTELKRAILEHPEFSAFQEKAGKVFGDWRKVTTPRLTGFGKDGHPKEMIEIIAEDLLAAFRQAPLLDAYDVYQHLMDYWVESMQDDAYLIAADGWVKGAQPREIVQVKGKNNKLTWPEPHDYLKGRRRFKSDLVPAPLLVARYFVAERDALEALDNQLSALEQQLDEMREENGGEDGSLAEVIEGEGDKQKIAARAVKARLREVAGDPLYADERAALERYADLLKQQLDVNAKRKTAQKDLDQKIDAKFPAHRGRDQDAGGGRQVVGARVNLCAQRDGSRLADAHGPHPPTGGTLRYSAPEAHRDSGGSCCPRRGASKEDGGGVELRPAYRLTDYGPIPEDWCLRPVSDMGEVITGKALAADGPGEQRPYLRTKNVFDGRIDIGDVLSMPMTDEQFSQFTLKEGDVLLNEGQSLELVGRCAIYGGEYPGPCAIQNQLLRFRAHAGVSGLFASHLFRYCQQKGVFARVALQTTSIAHLGGKRFEQLLVPWPPTEGEQCAISAALSDVDALLDGVNRLIAKKRDLKQATMQQLLSGQTRLPGFSAEWAARPLCEVGDIRSGGTPNTTQAHFWNGGVPWCTPTDVTALRGRKYLLDTARTISTAGLQFSSAEVIPPRSLIMTSRATVGECAINLVPVTTNQGFKSIVTFAEIDVEFLYYLLTTQKTSLVALCAEHKRYYISDFQNISLPVPKYDEQLAVVSVLSDMDAEIAALEARRDKTRDLKQAMMQELLTGKTRLVQREATYV